MRIITTLLVLLLASPSVLAETWVCSYVENAFPSSAIKNPGDITTLQFIRTTSGFESPTRNAGNIEWDLIHEDEFVLVLHYTSSNVIRDASPARVFNFSTELVQIDKNDGYNFFFIVAFSATDSRGRDNSVYEGTCTIVD